MNHLQNGKCLTKTYELVNALLGVLPGPWKVWIEWALKPEGNLPLVLNTATWASNTDEEDILGPHS